MTGVVGLGIDVVEVDRLRQALGRWGDRFLHRLFTETELARAGRTPTRAPRLAARFAAKEAVMKALGVGLGTMRWREIEVETDPSGKPLVRLHGKAREKADAIGVGEVAVSLTHTTALALATAIAFRR